MGLARSLVCLCYDSGAFEMLTHFVSVCPKLCEALIQTSGQNQERQADVCPLFLRLAAPNWTVFEEKRLGSMGLDLYTVQMQQLGSAEFITVSRRCNKIV